MMMRIVALALLMIAVPATAQDSRASNEPAAQSPAVRVIDPRASVDGLAISALAPQTLPGKGCTAFLWTRTPSMALVAMAMTDPAALRLSIDGNATDLAISAQNGIGGLGFSQITEYRNAAVTVTLQGTVRTDAGTPKSGSIAEATLRIDRVRTASVVVPVAGAITCA